MKLITLLFVSTSLASFAQTKICHIPFSNMYYVAIKPEKVSAHSDALCKVYVSDTIANQLAKIIVKSKCCNVEKCGSPLGDYRVAIKFSKDERNYEIYLTPFGHLLFNGQMYKPNKKLQKYLAELLSVKWF